MYISDGWAAVHRVSKSQYNWATKHNSYTWTNISEDMIPNW